MEAETVARKRRVPFQVDKMDLRYLLTEREDETRARLDEKYLTKYGSLASNDQNLVYFLGDSAEYCSWSAASLKIPTYRMNSKTGKYWMPAHHRWLTAKERLCSMGFPCTPEIARSMDVPMLGAKDAKRAADLCGNAMHFTSCGIMQLIALACFGPCDPDDSTLTGISQ